MKLGYVYGVVSYLMRLRRAVRSLVVIGPGDESAMGCDSTRITGRINQLLFVRKSSSASSRSEILRRRFWIGMSS